jgi:hypothetical protein
MSLNCSKKYCLLIFALMAQITSSLAQTYKGSSWAANLYLGVSNMRGDLGGSNFIGAGGIFNYDIRASRLAIGTGIAMNRGAWSLGANILGTRLAGNDDYTIEEFQTNRNLSVRTDLIEANLLLELRPFSRSAGFNRFYIYSGIGGIYYQPKAEYQDDWITLRTLGTEGQYFEGAEGPYSELDIVIPYGLGYKFRLGRSTSLVADLGFRYTFTDYLDDVSSVYVDPIALTESNGELAPILADRSTTPNTVGSTRGNPDNNDFYFLLGVKLEYILGGKAGDGCYYNRNPPKTRSTRINQRKMWTR